MKYYSDKTKKLYASVELLNEAEKAYDELHAAELKKAEERKSRADEVKEARIAAIEAQRKYNDLLNKFVKDYGSYHETYKDADLISINDIFNHFFF